MSKTEHNLGSKHSTKHTPLDIDRATPTYKVPVVDRSILEKLEYLDRRSGNPGETGDYSWSDRWPPLVTRIPESKFSSMRYVSYSETSDLCGPHSPSQRPCRFLVPYRIAGQESTARIHLLQMISLAHILNRTFVLPNVGKSRLGACLGWDFTVYYDTSGLDKQEIQYAKIEVLKSWIDLQHASRVWSQSTIVGQLIILDEKPKPVLEMNNLNNQLHPKDDGDALLYVSDMESLPDMGCFSTWFENLDMSFHNPVSFNIVSPTKIAPVGMENQLRDAFRRAAGWQKTWPKTLTSGEEDIGTPTSDPDILVINWDLRHTLLPTPALELRYPARLTDLAKVLAPSGPYLAVQWRMEGIKPEDLSQCAYALVRTLANMLHGSSLTEDVETIWLATDLDTLRLHKSSPKLRRPTDFAQWQDEAMKIIRSAFEPARELASWKLETLNGQLEGPYHTVRNRNGVWIDDSGVRGILDKLIAIDATLFVSGTRKCSRTRYGSPTWINRES
ncbi:hypothetical protein AMATHDRAFT_48234 [Amanita thiersii Skay4041]|uniref:Uncharacterized protein n=1 Tax=Amanita thiersii Skay4041 TaxID=703135 RepID=A0A2A9NGA6_9AGAR|nr:hypothetical protein AMATHDRAFT_48234 [Amanita thiersii Skay4041]